MPEMLTLHAKEKSTYVITVSFADEKGNAVEPDSVVWTLTDTAGTVINSLVDVAETPAEEIDVLLSDDDLQILSGEANQGVREFTVEAIYDSDLELNLPLKESVRFIVDNLLVVS